MKKFLLAFLLWVATAHAQSTTRMYLPTYPDTGTNTSFGGGNVLVCFGETPTQGITNATQIGFFLTGGLGGGGLCSITLYNADGTTQLGTTGAVNCAASGGKTVGSITPFSVTKGTKIQLCTCASVGGGTYLGADPGASSGVQLLQNLSSVPTATTAANACTAGVPPATTGVLTLTTANAIFAVLATNAP